MVVRRVEMILGLKKQAWAVFGQYLNKNSLKHILLNVFSEHFSPQNDENGSGVVKFAPK